MEVSLIVVGNWIKLEFSITLASLSAQATVAQSAADCVQTSALRQSEAGRALLEKILHSAACVQYVTSRQGPYKSDGIINGSSKN